MCSIARVFHYPCVYHCGGPCSPWFYWGPPGCARTMELASAVVLNNGGGQRHCSAPLFRTTALNNGAGHPPLFWRSLGLPVKYLFKPKAAWGPVVENTRVMKHTGDETHARAVKSHQPSGLAWFREILTYLLLKAVLFQVSTGFPNCERP